MDEKNEQDNDEIEDVVKHNFGWRRVFPVLPPSFNPLPPRAI
jgi:hypothetical protein